MSNERSEHIRNTVLKGGTKAVIACLDAEGNITSQEEVFRGCFSLIEHLSKIEDKQQQVKITITAEPAVSPDGNPEADGAEKEILLTEGTVEEATAQLSKKAMVPQHALAQLHLLLSRIMELSPLRGVIVTAVFEEDKGAGFSLLSESEPVNAAHIKTLGCLAVSQAQQFKEHIKNAMPDITFPDDEDKNLIITPAQANREGMDLRVIK